MSSIYGYLFPKKHTQEVAQSEDFGNEHQKSHLDNPPVYTPVGEDALVQDVQNLSISGKTNLCGHLLTPIAAGTLVMGCTKLMLARVYNDAVNSMLGGDFCHQHVQLDGSTMVVCGYDSDSEWANTLATGTFYAALIGSTLYLSRQALNTEAAKNLGNKAWSVLPGKDVVAVPVQFAQNTAANSWNFAKKAAYFPVTLVTRKKTEEVKKDALPVNQEAQKKDDESVAGQPSETDAPKSEEVTPVKEEQKK